ncbi:MAG: aminotransferase class I/II-fold pyridoxal phosphate-dependent enzyme [Tissierellia bacterium]|nr:aminotransferase class I/II-fold pyridoxal phosphate-dependent enzyme [Tissierellia bacterium]
MGKGKLYRRLKNLAEENYLRLHYPGHKGRLSWLTDGSLDYTETYGTDNLLEPEEILKTIQEDAARLYGVRASFYGVGGSTMALYAGLFSLTEVGERILVLRNAHKAIVQGAILRRLKVDSLELDFDEEWGIYTQVDLEKLEEALSARSYAALVVTSPDYFGNIQNLPEICALAHQYGTRVLVDEAHGAHLAFTDLAEHSAVRHADLVVQSVHKSLSGLTGSALLHVAGDVDVERVAEWVHAFTTTSPSYLMLVSIEEALLEASEGDWEGLRRNLEALPQLAGDELLFYRPSPHDFTKIMFQRRGYTGEELSQSLYERGINVEMSLGPYALAVASLSTTEEDVMRLAKTLRELPPGRGSGEKTIYRPHPRRKIMEPYEAQEEGGLWLPPREALGKVSRRALYAYPPGIPLLLPGEEITRELLEMEGLLGLKDGRMEIIHGKS